MQRPAMTWRQGRTVDRAGVARLVGAALIGAGLGVRAVQKAWTPGVLGVDGREWVAPVGVLASAAVGAALVPTRRLVPWPGMVTLLIAACLAGAYGCVPETNIIREWAYVIPAFAIGEIVVRRTLPLLAHLAMAGWVLWVALLGAVGRQSAFVGGIFALWPLVLPAIAVGVVPSIVDAPLWRRLAVPGIGVVAAWSVSRTGALQPTGSPAVVALVVAVACSAVATAWVVAPGRRQEWCSPSQDSSISTPHNL